MWLNGWTNKPNQALVLRAACCCCTWLDEVLWQPSLPTPFDNGSSCVIYVQRHKTQNIVTVLDYMLHVSDSGVSFPYVCMSLLKVFSLCDGFSLFETDVVRGYQLGLVQRGVSVRGCACAEGIPSYTHCIWFLTGVLRSSTGTPGPRDLPLAT
jgi:hypothetical protein